MQSSILPRVHNYREQTYEFNDLMMRNAFLLCY